jgi:EAL and modified HD-GYP domain-containing signal transduction protein
VVNSSAFGLNRQVESLRHAIVMLGISQVRHLAVLLALETGAKASEELVARGAERARLASLLETDSDKRSAAFTVGLLSVTDAIFQTSMEELLADLPVTDDIADALLTGTGPYGRTLQIIRACEDADMEALAVLMPDGIGELHHAYGEAISWANEIRTQFTRRAAV